MSKGVPLSSLGPVRVRLSTDSPTTREEFFWARVEKTQGCWSWTGKKQKLGYGQVKFRGVVTAAHRYSYELAFGPIPEDGVIDHLCHNPNCVNPSHLRVASHGQNMQNLRGAQANSKSGVRGVHWDAGAARWVALVAADGKRYRRRFKTLEEASAAAQEMRHRLHS